MSLLGIIGLIVAGVVAFGSLLLHLFGRSQRQQGALEERNAEQAKADEAKDRANEVLAEHRDPDDVDQRLRDGKF